MDNSKSKEFFANLAKSNPTPIATKINDFNDFTKYDVAFILPYVSESVDMLDLASGTGMTINEIYKAVRSITAVELYEEFSRHIVPATNVTVVNADIQSFISEKRFDVITMFGIVQYFNEAEIRIIYNKYFEMLNENGVILVKNQFGVTEDVLVAGRSEELKTNYYSEYRSLNKEIHILRETGFKDIEVVDVYPPECNRWTNTHFYGIIGRKKLV